MQRFLSPALVVASLYAVTGSGALAAPPEPVRWSGLRADTLQGRVLSEEAGRPVESARLRLTIGDELRRARSDSTGRFLFPEVPAGRHRLRVEANGFEPRELEVNVPEEGVGQVEVWLMPTGMGEGERERRAAVIRGTVVEAGTFRPVATARVRLEGTRLSTATDSAGRFVLRGVPPGPRVLQVGRIGYSTARLHLTVAPGERIRRRVELSVQALEMEDINVTADAMGRAEGELGTASVIEEDAIENQVAASVAGVLELIPGVPLSPPGLGEQQQFALRSVPTPSTTPRQVTLASGPTAAQLASFGTSVILDGVPLSNNNNLQTLGTRADLGLLSSAGGGIDLRRIPASTIQRVEVIRGVPSVRYGDLTQGAIVVQTKAGEVMPELLGRFDPKTFAGAAMGGTDLGGSHVGTATFDVTRTNVLPSFRDELSSRISGQLAHRAELGSVGPSGQPKVRLDTKIDFYRFFQEIPLKPEINPGRAAEREDVGWRLNERARIRLGGTSHLDVTAAISGTDRTSFSQRLEDPTATPLTTRRTEGREQGSFLFGSYISRVDLGGEPRNLFGRIELNSENSLFGLDHHIRAGTVVRREWNSGAGEMFDMSRPPRIPFNGVQGFDRPRSFEPIPPLVASAFYVDDRVTAEVAGGRLSAQAGLRADLLHEGSTWFSGVRDTEIQPRLTLEYAPVPGLRLRAGAGRTAKLPALDDLYPERRYYDVVNVNHFTPDPAERLAVLTTEIRDPTNPDLGFSTGEKMELALEVDLGANSGLSVVGFRDVVEGGVGLGFEPGFLTRERFAVRDTAEGAPPEVLTPPIAVDTVPILVDRPRNNMRLESRGIELTAFLPELRPIRTQLQVQGAWTLTDFSRSGLDFGPRSDWSAFQLDPDDPRAPYWKAPVGRGERAIFTYRAVHRQPELGLMIRATVQHYAFESEDIVADTDTLAFEGYVTRTGELVPIPPERRDDSEFRDLRQSRSGFLITEQEVPSDWLLSLRVAKTLPLDGRLSLYAFNALNREGKRSERGFFGRRLPDVVFGMEARFPLQGVLP